MAQAPFADRRSLGLKFLLVCVLAVLMSLPAYTIFAFIYERTSRADAVVQEVGETFGGQQAFVGPILVAPYRAARTVTGDQGRPVQQIEEGWYAVFARTGSADAAVDTDVRERGIFKVRTYAADVDFSARFDLQGEPSAAPEGAVIDWSRAVILIGVADPRSAAATAQIQIEGGATIPLEPGSAYANVFPGAGLQSSYEPSSFRPTQVNTGMQWMAADVSGLARPGAQFALTSRLRFSGVESLSLAAFARDTDLRIHGDWADVSYVGSFPSHPDAQSQEAFDARWSVPLVARNIANAGPTTQLAGAVQQFVTTRFVDPSNPYQSVTRALKYAILFIGVVFLAYFLFESTSPLRVHPAQYVLVGLAQVIFYLLLLAIAERVGFDWAFLIAATATVLLIGLYLGAVFKDKQRGYAGVAAFAVLYALIYLLMRLEDYALLVGSLAAFVAIAAAMYYTRNLDWYGLGFSGNGGLPREGYRPSDDGRPPPPNS
jgi:inner membrane protein